MADIHLLALDLADGTVHSDPDPVALDVSLSGVALGAVLLRRWPPEPGDSVSLRWQGGEARVIVQRAEDEEDG